MKKNFLLILFFSLFISRAQTTPKPVKFDLGLGVEYRLTPMEEVDSKPNNFLNFSANLSGVPVKFWLAYHLNSNWRAGFKYCVRYDHTGIESLQITGNYQSINSSFSLISDYVLYVRKSFPLHNKNKLSLKLGYAWMNQGVTVSVFENNSFHFYRYNFRALNFETNYHYKFFYMGMGIYYDPSTTHSNYTGSMQLLYLSMGFNVLKF